MKKCINVSFPTQALQGALVPAEIVGHALRESAERMTKETIQDVLGMLGAATGELLRVRLTAEVWMTDPMDWE